MNIFVLDHDIFKIPSQMVDKHVPKMILEYAQILSTACRLQGIDRGYKSTHVNHPCVKWVMQSQQNWNWLMKLCLLTDLEWRHRWNHPNTLHKSTIVALLLPNPKLPDIGMTPFVQCVPDSLKRNDPVLAYRAYYITNKSNMATWTNRPIPEWYDPNNPELFTWDVRKSALQ